MCRWRARQARETRQTRAKQQGSERVGEPGGSAGHLWLWVRFQPKGWGCGRRKGRPPPGCALSRLHLSQLHLSRLCLLTTVPPPGCAPSQMCPLTAVPPPGCALSCCAPSRLCPLMLPLGFTDSCLPAWAQCLLRGSAAACLRALVSPPPTGRQRRQEAFWRECVQATSPVSRPPH